MTNGARDIDSTPPAIARSISPARMARAAAPTASSPEAQSRFSVTPGVDFRQPGEEKRHARDVAIVLARLVGAAEIDLVDVLADRGMALDERADRRRGKVVGAHARKRAAIAADRRAHGIADEDVAASAARLMGMLPIGRAPSAAVTERAAASRRYRAGAGGRSAASRPPPSRSTARPSRPCGRRRRAPSACCSGSPARAA